MVFVMCMLQQTTHANLLRVSLLLRSPFQQLGVHHPGKRGDRTLRILASVSSRPRGDTIQWPYYNNDNLYALESFPRWNEFREHYCNRKPGTERRKVAVVHFGHSKVCGWAEKSDKPYFLEGTLPVSPDNNKKESRIESVHAACTNIK